MNDVLTGQVNFGTPKGSFLYFFFRWRHATQLNQGWCAQRGYLFNDFGTDRGMHRQRRLTGIAYVSANIQSVFSAIMCQIRLCLCSYSCHFLLFFCLWKGWDMSPDMIVIFQFILYLFAERAELGSLLHHHGTTELKCLRQFTLYTVVW